MNDARIMQGQKHFPLGTNGLTQKGIDEADSARDTLEEKNITRIFSSDLERCKETTEILNKNIKVPVMFSELLREQNCGDWEGRKNSEIFTEEIKEKVNNEIEVVPNGGESLKDVEKRIIKFLNNLLNEYDNKNILVITHAAVIQAMLGYFMQIPYNYRFRIKQKSGCINYIILSKDCPPQIINIGCIKKDL